MEPKAAQRDDAHEKRAEPGAQADVTTAPLRPPDATRPWIVVGVDGSEGADRALRWAITRASTLGARVLAVEAYSVPKLGTLLDVMESEDVEDVRTVVTTHAARAVARARGAVTLAASVDIEASAVEGSAVSVLLEQALNTHASLLVVGSRGRGGFAGLVLGSVSAELAHHAPCPLVIVPSPTS